MKRRCKYSGFTLVEVMVALALFAILSVGGFVAIPRIREVVVKSERAQVASTLMSSQLEELRILPFEALVAMLAEGGQIESNQVVGAVEYQLSCSLVSYQTDLYHGDAISATVVCDWENPRDSMQSETYWTLFTRDGLSDKAFSD